MSDDEVVVDPAAPAAPAGKSAGSTPALPRWALELAEVAVGLHAREKTGIVFVRFDGKVFRLYIGREAATVRI